MRTKGGEPQVLLIKDSYGRWIWPKGHIEEGEEPEDAARREVSEETGLKELKILDEIGRQEYWFALKGERIFKTVYVFLIEASANEKLHIQVEEIRDGRWFSPEDALDTIEYEGSRDLLDIGIKLFNENLI